MLWHELSCGYDCVCHANTSNRSGTQRCSVQYFSLYCNLQATARRIACAWTQAWLNQPILRKPLSFMLFETPKCVCVCVRPSDLFSSMSSIVYCAVQRFAEREEITMTGVSKLSAAVEKALRGFFSFLLLSHCLFFPLHIALSFSLPCNIPPHTHTHTQ